VLDPECLSSPLMLLSTAVREPPATARSVLQERPFLGKIMLHLDARDDRLASAACLALGYPLPARGYATEDGDLYILRLSPEAYLIVTPANDQYAYLARLRVALAGGRASLTDVSSGYATFRISGSSATELLYRGCSVPLEAANWAAGNCMTTSFGRFTVIIHWVAAAQAFDLYVPRSLALSLWNCLVEGGRDSDLLTAPVGADRG
jgi:heterotetrameric sarcosine oxidase gamma subunit